MSVSEASNHVKSEKPQSLFASAMKKRLSIIAESVVDPIEPSKLKISTGNAKMMQKDIMAGSHDSVVKRQERNPLLAHINRP